MNRARYRSWLLGVALLSFVGSRPVWAISPSIILIYGDGLPKPIVIQITDPKEFPLYTFFWATPRGGANYETQRGGTVPQGLSGRPYLKVAIFWERRDLETLKPEDASQHARLYLPSKSEPPVVVATAPWMYRPKPVAVPVDLGEFVAGWVLKSEDLATAKRLAIPGF
jgi:hypothetical protein